VVRLKNVTFLASGIILKERNMFTSENTYCDKCSLPYFTMTNASTCECHLEVDATHTDPAEKRTATALKYRIENRVMREALEHIAKHSPQFFDYTVQIAKKALNKIKEIQK
jgi:hypothetical protein